jgi:putative membrane protein
MKRTGVSWVAVAAIILLIGGCSKAQETKPEGTKAPPASQQPPARPTAIGTGGTGADVKSDGEFVNDVAIMNLAEVELSRVALGKAIGGDIKSFAQRMIDDHNAAGNALKTAVSAHSIEWPAQLDEKHKETVDGLTRKSGPDFDRDYAKAMVEGHQDLAAKLESRLDLQSVAEWKTAVAARAQSKALPDPKVEMADVKVRPAMSSDEITMKINQWAADTYPVVQKHLDTARALEKASKKSSTH